MVALQRARRQVITVLADFTLTENEYQMVDTEKPRLDGWFKYGNQQKDCFSWSKIPNGFFARINTEYKFRVASVKVPGR